MDTPDAKPLPRDCPTCKLRLISNTSRQELDADGQPELVYVYLCLQHGFFTFRKSKGLVEGL